MFNSFHYICAYLFDWLFYILTCTHSGFSNFFELQVNSVNSVGFLHRFIDNLTVISLLHHKLNLMNKSTCQFTDLKPIENQFVIEPNYLAFHLQRSPMFEEHHTHQFVPHFHPVDYFMDSCISATGEKHLDFPAIDFNFHLLNMQNEFQSINLTNLLIL
jgi:hypothetical protein